MPLKRHEFVIDASFSEVIAVDSHFVLFSRAWCVAEVAAAHQVGMKQTLKIVMCQPPQWLCQNQSSKAKCCCCNARSPKPTQGSIQCTSKHKQYAAEQGTEKQSETKQTKPMPAFRHPEIWPWRSGLATIVG